jgi:hypothetical protein
LTLTEIGIRPTRDPYTFANKVESTYRLYRKNLLTGREFADVVGEHLYKLMNYQEDE